MNSSINFVGDWEGHSKCRHKYTEDRLSFVAISINDFTLYEEYPKECFWIVYFRDPLLERNFCKIYKNEYPYDQLSKAKNDVDHFISKMKRLIIFS